jgi:hypothetical protein
VSNIGKRSTAYRVGTAGLFTLALFGFFHFVPAVAAQGHAHLLGVVSDEETGAVIGSAQVTVKGTGIDVGIDTRTTADGTFEFSSVPAGMISVRVQAPGYPVIVEDVELEPNAEHIVYVVLPTVQAILEDILVVGRVRHQGNAETAADLLERQIPGFNANQGDRGTGDSPIFLRGASSFHLSEEPTIFVDGVRISGSALEVLMLIPSVSVKSIRIDRGPATTSVVWSSTGAIHISTR